MFKRFFHISIFLLLIGLFIEGCGSSTEVCSIDSNANYCNSKAHYTVLVDNRVSDSHKSLICKALSEWNVKTNGALNYTIQYVNMSFVPNDLSGNKDTIKVFFTDLGEKYWGWTEWNVQGNRARVLFTFDLTDEQFYPVALHEFGHAFHLAHYKGPYKSVMHPYIGNTNKLECADLRAFCAEWGCQIDCDVELISNYKSDMDKENVCLSLEVK